MIKRYAALAALLFVFAFSAIQAQQAQFALPNFTEADCEANTINLKVKDQYRNLCSASGINHTALNNYLGYNWWNNAIAFPQR
ncbi:MAG: hypothetical protein M0D57_21465 [Sphingobacteriales bacterium JAD_PAG50586_3]|nr:MAG: hypothetical protein M0D57_21465 [Sphingobacteriales bacterium JAD_PAG50586_3]